MSITKKPNIVIVISDALRPKDMGLYGRPIENTPCISEIAAESALFSLNFSAANGSDPSITSLFSGQNPTTSGFIHQHPFMRNEEIDKLKKNSFWLPLYLQKKGYSTISATPLHMWFKKGFDTFTEKDQLKGKGRFLDIPIVKRMLLALPNWAYRLGKKSVKIRASPEFYSCNSVINFAIQKIEEISATEKPFFIFMHLVDTHYPYPISKIRKIPGEKTAKTIIADIHETKQKEYIKKRFFDLDAENMEQIEKKRDESIVAVDSEIGRLHKFLKNKKLWDDTIFIFLSDHGDNFGEHNVYFCRGGLYDPSVRVPLIVHAPGILPTTTEELTQNIDVAPTILDLLDEPKINVDGKSLLPIMANGEKVHDSILLSDSFCNNRIAIRTKEKKIVVGDGGPCYLCGAVHHYAKKEEYNIENDPDELKNVYSVVSELEGLIPPIK